MAFWDGQRWLRGPADGSSTRVRGRRSRLTDWLATGVLVVGLASIGLVTSDTRASGPRLTIAPDQGPAGAVVTANVIGLPPSERVTMKFGQSRVGPRSLRTDSAGGLSIAFVVPDLQPGEHDVTVETRARRSNGGGRTRSESVGVTATTTFVLTATEPQDTTPPSGTGTPLPTGTTQPASAGPTGSSAPTQTPTPFATATQVPATPVPTQVPTQAPSVPPAADARILFGLGPTVDGARDARLTLESKVKILTAWYNGPNDIGWMTDAYHRDMYARQYAAGRDLQLIVWTGDSEGSLSTSYGTACGRGYPLSSRFLDDIRRVADAFSGSGRLYVTLFTEFQTYPCTDNAWNPNAATNNYLRALKDRYLEARTAILAVAPRAQVSLGWGGWQARWDDPSRGGGRSMFQYFGDIMAASDFQSFQAMQSDTNIGDVRAMTRILGAWGPVMLAHYKPDNGSQSTFDADVRAMLTSDYLTEMSGLGLFAWSFMDQANLNASSSTYTFVRDALNLFGR